MIIAFTSQYTRAEYIINVPVLIYASLYHNPRAKMFIYQHLILNTFIIIIILHAIHSFLNHIGNSIWDTF